MVKKLNKISELEGDINLLKQEKEDLANRIDFYEKRTEEMSRKRALVKKELTEEMSKVTFFMNKFEQANSDKTRLEIKILKMEEEMVKNIQPNAVEEWAKLIF